MLFSCFNTIKVIFIYQICLVSFTSNGSVHVAETKILSKNPQEVLFKTTFLQHCIIEFMWNEYSVLFFFDLLNTKQIFPTHYWRQFCGVDQTLPNLVNTIGNDRSYQWMLPYVAKLRNEGDYNWKGLCSKNFQQNFTFPRASIFRLPVNTQRLAITLLSTGTVCVEARSL